jgi:L,D-transpeptidase ErfK/SrfK
MKKIPLIFSSIFVFFTATINATTYTLPSTNDSMIGSVHIATIGATDTLASIQKEYDVGFNALDEANPHLNINRDLPFDAPIVIPTQHLIPRDERKGVVINLPEMRMYYFPEHSQQVFTYPIGIGKIGKTIPITKTVITRKVTHPTWIPTPDIRQFNLQQGVVLPKTMPAGPDNPLGPYAIYMRLPTYLIHSTIFPESVGKRASFGCIRMLETNIEEFFPSITPGIPVTIINAPIKLGWQDHHLYMEAHHPLEEHQHEAESTLAGAVHLMTTSVDLNSTLVDWQTIAFISEERDGIPHDIGVPIH